MLIKRLIEECTVQLPSYTYVNGNTLTTYFDKEKFAKLIIKECAGVCCGLELFGAANALQDHFRS